MAAAATRQRMTGSGFFSLIRQHAIGGGSVPTFLSCWTGGTVVCGLAGLCCVAGAKVGADS
jgi:hypothetical protein